MRVFLSWSGPRAKALALALFTWLPDVLQSLDPFMSDQSIDLGTKPTNEIHDALQEPYGIIVANAQSIKSEWVNWEAGALAKSLGGVDGARLWVLLDGISPTDIHGPIGQVQATTSLDKDDLLRLVESVNAQLTTGQLPPERLSKSFERSWPELQTAIENLPALDATAATPDVTAMTEEILLTVRRLDSQTRAQQIDAIRKRMSAIQHEIERRKGSAPESSAPTLDLSALGRLIPSMTDTTLIDLTTAYGQTSGPNIEVLEYLQEAIAMRQES